MAAGRIINTFKCSRKWEDLTGAGDQRFCDGCAKHVTDLRNKTDDQIAALLDGKEICGVIQTPRLFNRFASLQAGLALASMAFMTVPVFSQSQQEKVDTTRVNTSENKVLITGLLKDSKTGEPIPFGNVVLKKDGVIICGASTDFDGKYSFALDTLIVKTNQLVELEVACIGYETIIKKSSVKDLIKNKLVVKMKIGTELLSVGLLISLPVSDPLANPTKTTITRDDIRRMP